MAYVPPNLPPKEFFEALKPEERERFYHSERLRLLAWEREAAVGWRLSATLLLATIAILLGVYFVKS